MKRSTEWLLAIAAFFFLASFAYCEWGRCSYLSCLAFFGYCGYRKVYPNAS